MANLYMEYLEKKDIDSSPLKPRDWKRFVDDTNIIWPHGREILDKFLEDLNNQSDPIKFTMGIQENNRLPFLDILVTKKEDASLLH